MQVLANEQTRTNDALRHERELREGAMRELRLEQQLRMEQELRRLPPKLEDWPNV